MCIRLVLNAVAPMFFDDREIFDVNQGQKQKTMRRLALSWSSIGGYMSYLKKKGLVSTDVRPVISVNRRGIAAAVLLLLAAAFVAAPAMAELPAAVQPTGGAAAGDYTQLLRQYWKAGVAVLVLLVGTWAFIEVGGGAIAKFSEWRRGKVELGELKWYFLIGVVMLVLVIYLLTTANGVL